MALKKQVVIISGGDFFDSRDEFFASLRDMKIEKEDVLPKQNKWKDNLQSDLGDGYEVLRPEMPLRFFARYEEWKCWFEKMFPFFEDGLVLVGHSLGGIFLARYLSENNFPNKIRAVFFVAAPYFGAKSESENSGFVIRGPLALLERQGEKLVFYYSEDDEIVSAAHAERYRKELSSAEYRIFKNRGHFFAQEHFPEIVKAIRAL